MIYSPKLNLMVYSPNLALMVFNYLFFWALFIFLLVIFNKANRLFLPAFINYPVPIFVPGSPTVIRTRFYDLYTFENLSDFITIYSISLPFPCHLSLGFLGYMDVNTSFEEKLEYYVPGIFIHNFYDLHNYISNALKLFYDRYQIVLVINKYNLIHYKKLVWKN